MLLLKLEITDDHFRRGNLRSVMNDPIGLAIREHYDLRIPPEVVAIGDDEVFLSRLIDGKLHHFEATYDVKGFYLLPNRPKVITLSFRET
jgi:hypothetical protein